MEFLRCLTSFRVLDSKPVYTLAIMKEIGISSRERIFVTYMSHHLNWDGNLTHYLCVCVCVFVLCFYELDV